MNGVETLLIGEDEQDIGLFGHSVHVTKGSALKRSDRILLLYVAFIHVIIRLEHVRYGHYECEGLTSILQPAVTGLRAGEFRQ